jgi:PIN domain nuclease of toxin-antitoxin system
MRILLDTNAWVWYVSGAPELGKNAQKIIANNSNELFLSSISIWEVILLGEKKRLELSPSVQDWLDDALKALPVIDVPISRTIAMISRKLSFRNEDPADRFIAASAFHEEMTLLTSDQALLSNQLGISVLDARK